MTTDVPTTIRNPLTKLQRSAMFERHKGLCIVCGLPIDKDKGFIDEHIRPLGLGGTNNPDNRAPAHKFCAAKKTLEDDMPRINKAKAQKAKSMGSSPDKKPTFQSRGFDKKPKPEKLPMPKPKMIYHDN